MFAYEQLDSINLFIQGGACEVWCSSNDSSINEVEKDLDF